MSDMTLLGQIQLAFKKNLLPGSILQLLAISIALAYFFWPASLPVFAFFADLKETYGSLYALVATALFGGFIPFMYLWLTGVIKSQAWQQCVFYMIFWAYKGMEVDLFYQLQGEWFGHGNDVKTIVIKTSMDQFIYSALWSAPTITLLFLWKDLGFSWQALRAELNSHFFFTKIPTIIISNWLVWIPAVCVIYMMPAALQIPLFNLVLCFFVLLLAFLTPKEAQHREEKSEATA